MKDNLVALFYVLLLLFIFVVWPVFYFTADCDKLDWMSLSHLPSRCLKVDIHP